MMTAQSRVFTINFRFPPTLLRPAVPCLNFADLRELAREFVPEMTGGQITLMACRGCPDVRDFRESGEKCVSFGKGSCLVCFAIFGRLWRFCGKRFSRENVPEMTDDGT